MWIRKILNAIIPEIHDRKNDNKKILFAVAHASAFDCTWAPQTPSKLMFSDFLKDHGLKNKKLLFKKHFYDFLITKKRKTIQIWQRNIV